MLKPHRLAHRVLVMAVAASLLILAAPAVDAAEDQPQVGFASGETPVTPNPDPVDIYLANADGTGVANLTAGYGGYWPWAWAPDGSRIAFYSRDGTTDKLYVRALDEAEPFVVAVGPDRELGGPRWSPDGTRIAFVSSQDGNGEVYVADVAARTARNVSNDPWPSSDPYWSPTGSHLSYSIRQEDGDQRINIDIYVVPVSGGSPVNVTDDPSWSLMGSWSPDGSRFLYVSNREGNDKIYLADADGRNPVRLTNSPANDRDPAWSPDGSRIAFSSGLDVRIEGTTTWQIVIPSRIYVMNADGSGRRSLTDGSIDPSNSLGDSLAHAGPTWSPDGSRLAFAVSLAGAGPHQRVFTVYVVNSATGTPPVELWDGGGGWHSRWSPDGARLAIRSTGNYGVDSMTVIANADGSGTPLVLTGGVGSGSAGWSTYGTHLAYMNSGGFQPGDTVFVAAPDGTEPVDITAGLAGPLNSAASWRPQELGPVGLVDPSTGLWHLDDGWGFVTSFYYGNPGDYPFMGDWDCDGIDTPGLYRQSDGFAYLRNSNSQGIADIRFFFGNPGDVPLAGDFDGDGCDTLSIYRPSEARIYVINQLGSNDGGLGAAEFSYIFGNPGDKPFTGDFDGDNIDTVGLHRESTGFVYFRQTHSQGIADEEFFFGDPGDRLVAGDWGIVDGVDTPAIFRPSNATFYYRHTNTQGVADSQSTWGQSDWLPVSGSFGLD